MRSESGNTVDEPAVIMSPVTASGAYMAIGSSVGAVVGSAGAEVAAGSVGAEVGSTGASVGVEEPQAASKRLMATNTNSNGRTNLVISISPIIFYTLKSYQSAFKVKRRTG